MLLTRRMERAGLEPLGFVANEYALAVWSLREAGSGDEARAAEGWFIRARDMARRQDALSWELRAAMSLARFWRDHGRTAEARKMLYDVHQSFTEGFDAAGPRAARRLLDELG